jgi:tripartite-type tricarboxylate transporter receptor subunit TctC
MKPLLQMVSHRRRRILILLLSMILAPAPLALAQDYPARPITIIVPLVAGGGPDTLARILADRMTSTLGQPIVVENIPTAAGTVGVSRLARSAPDGYTIGVGDQTTNLVSSFTTPVPYDVLNDFEPISLLTTSSIVLVGRTTIPAADVKQLIAWIRGNPEGAKAGTFGQGSGPHILSVAFQNLTGTKLNLVPYRGTPLALQDIISGQIDLLFIEQSNIVGALRSGTIKAFAVWEEVVRLCYRKSRRSRRLAAPRSISLPGAGCGCQSRRPPQSPNGSAERWSRRWATQMCESGSQRSVRRSRRRTSRHLRRSPHITGPKLKSGCP